MESDALKGIQRSLERVGKILAGILLKDIEQGDQTQKIARLKQCGFQNFEIADMLGTSRNNVNVRVHALRYRHKRKKKTRRKN